MKTRILLVSASALLFGACTTGSYVTSSYVDDIYFNPGDVPPPVVAEKVEQPKEQSESDMSGDKLIISQIRDNKDGSKTMNNYIYGNKDGKDYSDAQLYNMDQQKPDQSDTTVLYNEDDVKYVINNYYEGDDLDYTYRIRRFHRPYFFDPFYWDSWAYDPFYWNSWYSPGWSFGWNYGWGSWYSPYSMYGGFGWDPFYFGGFYYPYYGMGYPYNSWYSPYYSGNWGGNWRGNSDNYRYEHRRSENTNVVYGAGGSGRLAGSASGRNLTDKSAREGVVNSEPVSRRDNSISGGNGGSHPRAGVDGGTTEKSATTNSGILSERRRDTNAPTSNLNRYNNTSINRSNVDNQTINSNSELRRSNNESGTARTYNRNDYQPSYNQLKSATRSSSYNRETYTRPATSSYSQPRVISRGSNSGSAAPQSSSSLSNTYRSSSTYNRSSSSGVSGRSYNSNSGGYSSPGRSNYNSSGNSGGYSAPSSGGYSSGGGSYSGGSSGGGSYSGGSSGGGGGSSSHSSGVSSSGRR